MKQSKLVFAITMAINSSALLGTAPQARANDLLALNRIPDIPRASVPSSQPAPTHATGEELLARGMARLATAKQPREFRTAYHFLELAAQKGIPEAQFQLGLMQLDNNHVNGNEETAIKWLEAAIAQGHKQAAIALEYVQYQGGDIGC